MFSKNLKLIEYLIKNSNKEIIKSVNNNGNNILYLAFYNNENLDVIKYLYFLFKDDFAFFYSKNNYGYNIFHSACYNNGNVEVVRFLYEQFFGDSDIVGANDNYGSTPLSYLKKLQRNLLGL